MSLKVSECLARAATHIPRRWMPGREPSEMHAFHDIVGVAFGETKMADEQFKAGDIVSLRSGGPKMTIATVDGQTAFCEWFTDDQHPQGKSFHLASLKLDERR